MDRCWLNLTTQLDLGNVEVDIMWLTAGSAYPCQSQGESEGLMVVEGENVVAQLLTPKLQVSQSVIIDMQANYCTLMIKCYKGFFNFFSPKSITIHYTDHCFPL